MRFSVPRCRAAVVSFVVVIGAVGALPSSAQDLKITAGVAYGEYAMSPGDTREWLPGFVGGGGLVWRGRPIGVEIDVLYVVKSSRYVSRSWDFSLGELSVPVLVRIQPRWRVAPFFVGGGEVAVILSQHTTDPFNPDDTVSLDTRRFDLGLVAGAGLAIETAVVGLDVELRYHHGLIGTTQFVTDDEFEFKTRVLALVAGVRF